MNRDRRSSSTDPASEPVSDRSSQSDSGLSSGRPAPDAERDRDYTEDVVNRSAPVDTPRRYEQPLEDDEDPVMPADDSTLNTKI